MMMTDTLVGDLDPKRTLLVIGSSVADGQAAPMHQGWAHIVGQELKETHTVHKVCQGGTDTAFWLHEVPMALAGSRSPSIVIVSLSLANEGIITERNPQEIASRFLKQLQDLVDLVQRQYATGDKSDGPVMLVGSVYPNSFYPHVEGMLPIVLSTLEEQRRLFGATALVDFWSATATAAGGWKDNMEADPSHPNLRGHQAMAEAVIHHIRQHNL